MQSVESPNRNNFLGRGAILFWAAVLFHVVYLLALQPGWLLGGAMWAEMGPNYFDNANAPSLYQNFFAVDAGYVPLPQRIVAYIGALFSIPAVSVPYYYSWMSVALISLLICSFLIERFRAVIESDGLRLLVVIAVLMVADFESRTFINFTYFSVFFIGAVIALALSDRKNDLPLWAWLVPFLFVSKPAVMTILPVLVFAALLRPGRIRAIAVVSVLFCLVQVARMVVSANTGWTPLQHSDSSLFYKGYLALVYTVTLFGRFLLGPDFQAGFGTFAVVGSLVLAILGLAFAKVINARPLLLVGVGLVAFTALLNCLAFSLVWTDSFQPVVTDFRISRYILTAYIGFVFVVAACAAILASAAARFRFGRLAAVVIFSLWFIGTGWASYGTKISRQWVAPGLGNSYWKEFSGAIDQGVTPLCVPIDPFPWLYGRNCERLTPLAEQNYVLKQIKKSDEGYLLEVPISASVQSRNLVSIALFIKPASDSDSDIRGRALVEDMQGQVHELHARRVLPSTGGLLLFTQLSGQYIESFKRIRIVFEQPVDVAYQSSNQSQPSIVLMGTKYMPESIGNILRRAVDGDVSAQLVLGRMYSEGQGVAKNPGEGVNWYMKAAATDNAEAQYWLARAYDTGIGVVENKVEASVWYQKAALNGSQDAVNALERLKPRAK